MATDKIKVAVRVRPFNRRELELGTQCVVEMTGQQTILQHPITMDKIDRLAHTRIQSNPKHVL
ncbi:Kinesin-like protein KIF13A [Camponotus floridanus]|uniref:Kinesin-like protein KIF13A n=1 Tax=Camponotus floridanus TaxID=104421 RepID=E2ARY9_CAMFO|nr:Kinesin-like protein KIF13A [Camponotus floridanus]